MPMMRGRYARRRNGVEQVHGIVAQLVREVVGVSRPRTARSIGFEEGIMERPVDAGNSRGFAGEVS